MKTSLFTIMLLVLLAAPLYGQTGSIINTLGVGGSFTIKDSATAFLSLNQSDGNLGLNHSLTLPHTTSSTLGVIFKGGERFLHNYQSPGTVGFNTFLGRNAGNFDMSGSGGQASSNIGIGDLSLSRLTTGSENTAVGYQSLLNNSAGNGNTAVGYVSSSFTNGNQNTAVGHRSLASNSAGNQNTAVGGSSLFFNSTGSENTAVGYQSLYRNTTGYHNTAVGIYSLTNNTDGFHNTAVGRSSLYYNSTGTRNTAMGYGSLTLNTTGFQNTAVGDSSLYQNTGNYNTALGYNAGSTITTGANLTCIGIDAAPTSPTAVDQITLGNVFVSSLRCNVTTITALSDARDKKNIRDLNLGLDFLMKVKPRQFNWDKRQWYENNIADGSKMNESPTAGFIAQELDAVQNAEHAGWLNLILKDNPDKLEATPGNLLPIMVKAIQELKTENEALRNELVTLRRSIAEQVKKEVRTAVLKAVQPDDKTSRVSLDETKE